MTVHAYAPLPEARFYDLGDGYVMVADPAQRHRWIRTQPCVVRAKCPACGSDVLEPCKTDDGYLVHVHPVRIGALRNGGER